MDEKKEKNDGNFNYLTWIIIAIFASFVIGIRVYTRYLEKQNEKFFIEHQDAIMHHIYNHDNN